MDPILEELKGIDEDLKAAEIRQDANEKADKSRSSIGNTENDMGEISLPFKFPKSAEIRVNNLDEIPEPKEFPEEIRISNLDEIPQPIAPDSVSVSNLEDIKFPQFPEHIGIRKPAWLPLLFTPLKPIKDILDSILLKLEFKSEVKLPKTADEAIPVRLSDGKNFINQLTQVIGGGFSGGGSSMPRTRDIAGKEYGLVTSGIKLPLFDYVSMALSAGDTTETYTFREGGASGSTVAQIKIVYTDSNRTVLSTVTRT